MKGRSTAPTTCPCGSGKPRTAQYDARRIFLCYTCPKCHTKQMGRYREDVLHNPNYWHDEDL